MQVVFIFYFNKKILSKAEYYDGIMNFLVAHDIHFGTHASRERVLILYLVSYNILCHCGNFPNNTSSE